jgi:hypothetical protein
MVDADSARNYGVTGRLVAATVVLESEVSTVTHVGACKGLLEPLRGDSDGMGAGAHPSDEQPAFMVLRG